MSIVLFGPPRAYGYTLAVVRKSSCCIILFGMKLLPDTRDIGLGSCHCSSAAMRPIMAKNMIFFI